MSSSPLAAAITRHTDNPDSGTHGDGFYATAIAPLTLMRLGRQTIESYSLYKPALCVTVQGAKQVMLGDSVFDYGAMQYLAVSVDLPILGRVTQASDAAPFLALIIDIDIAMLQDVMRQTDHPADLANLANLANLADGGKAAPGVFIGTFDEHATACALKLMALLEQPKAIPVLANSVLRELYYWLLCGPQGALLRRLGAPDSHVQRIARAIALMRREFASSLGIDRLATLAGMSASSFHAHFKTVTSVTPLQYQKQLRLLQARRLIATHAANASQAAYQVGYESASQFSREYTRMFGAPPSRDGLAA